jgi:hypothetical protein
LTASAIDLPTDSTTDNSAALLTFFTVDSAEPADLLLLGVRKQGKGGDL